jgi:hypothetical protein
LRGAALQTKRKPDPKALIPAHAAKVREGIAQSAAKTKADIREFGRGSIVHPH